jgi:hypothetical protein
MQILLRQYFCVIVSARNFPLALVLMAVTNGFIGNGPVKFGTEINYINNCVPYK